MFVQDGLVVDRTWETNDGFLGFSARSARTDIQHYLGQIDPDGFHKDTAGNPRFHADALYPVQRDAAEVFAPRPGNRCLIPVTKFAEAEGEKGRKTRTWFSVTGQPIFAWAGMWRDSDEWDRSILGS